MKPNLINMIPAIEGEELVYLQSYVFLQTYVPPMFTNKVKIDL
jgi:hypothetical protein